MTIQDEPPQDEPAWERELWRKIATIPKQRAEIVMEQITELAASHPSGHRLGSKEELQLKSNVSVGTFNEALRLLQSRGIVSVRRGPGGGIFVAEQSVLTKLRNDVVSPDGPPATRPEIEAIGQALIPLMVEDATRNGTDDDGRELRERLDTLRLAAEARDAGRLHESSVELYVAMIAMCAGRPLRSFMKIVVEMDLVALSQEVVVLPDEHDLQSFVRDISALVDAIVTHDVSAAIGVLDAGNPFQFFTQPSYPAR
jgi:DNA-binding FadR family transcriptional regulator